MKENEITEQIIGAAIKLHKLIGAGLLESAYQAALAYDLRQLGFDVKEELPWPFIYKEIKMEVGYRVDLLIENKIIVEIKSIEKLAPVHSSQVLTYLKLSNLNVGLLINFNSKYLKDGLYRIVNNFK